MYYYKYFNKYKKSFSCKQAYVNTILIINFITYLDIII